MTEVKPGPDNTLVRRKFRHPAILAGAEGDTPELKGLSEFLGHSGYLGCSYCVLRGTRDKGMYFAGYAIDATGGAPIHSSSETDIFRA